MSGISANEYIDKAIADIRETVGEGRVLLGLSGGVDSSVCAALLSKAIGTRLTCILVDHGLMRKNEAEQVKSAFADFDFELICINAEERFLAKLDGVTEPELKRKIIGEEFIRVFEQASADFYGLVESERDGVKFENKSDVVRKTDFYGSVESEGDGVKFENKSDVVRKTDFYGLAESEGDGVKMFLAQGTIYPDVIESKSVKSHHNVGGLPEKVNFCGIVEPLKELYKDEVRQIGKILGLPDYLVNRQPFPGPGLGVRCIGTITKARLDMLREADAIFREEFENRQCQVGGGQHFAVLTDMKAVGVKDGERTYGYVAALRAVTTEDFMSAAVVRLPYEVLEKVADRITGEVSGITRVVYDVTGKPPGTIEWE